MKYLIIADIHSNLEAFQAVLDDVHNYGGFDHIWCLGDVVGYGPDPQACIDLLCNHEHLCVCGNHDLAAVGKIDISDFNFDAALANQWTSEHLTEANRQFLLNMPEIIIKGEFTIVHGSPCAPAWEYVSSTASASENFRCLKTPYCLVGHTHVPFVFEQDDLVISQSYWGRNDMLLLGEKKLIINPGGVGQPRDHDPSASYAIYDSDEDMLCHYRVNYDIRLTQDKMESAGLPGFLIERLAWGI